jgi:nucleoside-diphosphate-sugar epimerase
MKRKSVLITGINGFLGSHLAMQLSDEFNVIGLEYRIDNLFRLKGLPFKVYSSKEEDFEKIFTENDIYSVIHAATIYRKENEPIEDLLSTNIMLPVKLLVLSHTHRVKLFLNTDSFFNNSNSTYSYLSEYTLSKKHALEWLKEIKGKCKLINMKLFHIYGPNDSTNKFIPQMISSFKSNQPFINLTPGEQKRDFIFIDDVVSAYRTILGNYDKLSSNIHEFEVGTGNLVALREFINTIKDLTKSDTELRFGVLPYRKGEIMEAKADNIKLLFMGWKPRFNLNDGLQLLINSGT